MSSKGNLGMRRVQTLINNNQNEFITEVALQNQKIAFSPDDAATGTYVTGNTTLTNADSGKVVLINGAGEGNFTVTLPTAELGMQYVNINSRTVGFADAEKRGAMIELIYTGHWYIRHANSAVALVTSFS